MRRPDDPEVEAWTAKAGEDIEAVATLAEHAPHLADVICFHCQQAAEKLLKALCVASETPAPHTHDLDALMAALLPSLPELGPARDAATLLKSFAVLPRYPLFVSAGAPPTELVRDARAALDQIRALVEDVLG